MNHFLLSGSWGSACQESPTPEAIVARVLRRVVWVKTIHPAVSYPTPEPMITDLFVVWVALVGNVGDECRTEGLQLAQARSISDSRPLSLRVSSSVAPLCFIPSEG